MKYNLIIPSAGTGQRFIDAGYSIHKPFVTIWNKPMIEYVIDNFNDFANIIIIAAKSKKKEFTTYFKDDKIEFIFIDDHKNGPAFSLYKAQNYIKNNESYFVAYNDIVWDWNLENINDFIIDKNPDAIVFTNIGFHPHLFKNNFSAFCKLHNDRIVEIREKESFTSNWMKEYLSVGVFYYKTGLNLNNSIKELIESDNRVVSEFFPSTAINYLIRDGNKVLPYNVSNFIHWGIPEHLNDALNWKKILSKEYTDTNLNICMMLCGTGERMKTISKVNKAGLLVDGEEKMYKYVLSKFGTQKYSLIINDNVADIVDADCNIININKSTNSQTESLLNALPKIKLMKRTIFASNDCFGEFDTAILDKHNKSDIVIFGFKPSLLQKKQETSHTYFKTIGSKVSEILIKTKVVNALALAGFFYVPDGKIFEYLKYLDIENDTSFDHFVKYLIKVKKSVTFIELKNYVHLGTAEEFNEFSFWQNFYKNNNIE